jgi:hypothetical protein
MNEKQFISPISGYNHKIIKKYNFELYLEDKLFHDKSVVDKITIPFLKWNIEYNLTYFTSEDFRCNIENRNIDNII